MSNPPHSSSFIDRHDYEEEPLPLTRLKSLLTKPLRITISDGRTFIGSFMCTDQQRNTILTNTEEFRFRDDGKGGRESGLGRYVGMVMIPWKLVRRVEMEYSGLVGDEGYT
ncbi:hypothetical protein BD410DRAFT_257345 [Rickenella mellea]|uniref:Sm domain-containing protein n=1 Tax=Rickenella mellea TaxID=50990 RepID=A0A4Y7Q586_9AGAM|nr:hypothetical protein BD410DRAFT_257345 [Rickenella mellea]